MLVEDQALPAQSCSLLELIQAVGSTWQEGAELSLAALHQRKVPLCKGNTQLIISIHCKAILYHSSAFPVQSGLKLKNLAMQEDF